MSYRTMRVITEVVKKMHEHKWVGHPGQAHGLESLSGSYFFPKMEEEVEAYMCSCLSISKTSLSVSNTK